MKKLLLVLLYAACIGSAHGQAFAVLLPDSLSKKPLDGRLLLMLSNNTKAEPRFQINGGPSTQLIFGVDVENWKPGTTQMIQANSEGYPKQTLNEIPPGNYTVQVVLHIYETFKRKDGHVLKLPMDRGEGQHWNTAPGNLLSTPQLIKYDPYSDKPYFVSLNRTMPPIKEPQDTDYVKHIKIQSKLLTEFWGRPMYLGAHILLPQGWDKHPDVKYPLAVYHGHFPADFGDWRTIPADEKLKPDTSERFHITGYNKITQQENYNFYKLWTGPNFPRVIAIEIQHANQFYDDSYAVNSANIGPYGDAITYELIPEIEKRFRGIGKGWARFMYGGSTGGWEALAAQVFYPDEYNGCYAACPDPISFDHYTVVDLYKDKNAYYLESDFKETPRPGMTNYLGHISSTLKELNQLELVLGDKSRSGEQWDIWEAVFSPVGKDGYPARIWDKKTGVINKDIAAYWKEHFDLTHIIQRDWPKIGEKLKGKIHVYVGDMDNYYLNNAVYSAEDVLKKLKNPACGCEVDYGDRAEHCWNGDHSQPNYISRLRYHQMFITKWAEEMKSRVPKGADLTSWKY
ncbi:hypothetical protein [Dyadobacter arcticus]|uniref:Esterase n=1 Tax=Dyadobacter arcticus TaxID=1078754 RepID=A0ABX0UN14_9BACT|nr:hypothetical protein [Dyadobacter arcticus]NIJ53848.1 hypothetical protein [Dyadobacter arcticus]